MHLTFSADELPSRYRDVAAMFHRKGAYRRFKAVLESLGLLEKWYKFEEAALDSATRVLRREGHSDFGGITPSIGPDPEERERQSTP